MRQIFLAIAVAALAGCTTLPEHARPQVEMTVPSDPRFAPATVDAIPYRALTRDDFRAVAPPKGFGAHAGKMGAYTCGWIAPGGDGYVPMRVEALPGGGFLARPEGHVAVIARMDRNCSWWNTQPERPMDEAYTLQHEQIHFAMVELSAREATRRIATLEARGATPEAAGDALRRKFEAKFAEITKQLAVRSTDFDEDTSARHDPAAQRRWWEEVHAELSQR